MQISKIKKAAASISAIRDPLVYLLAAFPFAIDFLQTGRWIPNAFSLILNVVLSGVIFTIILLLRQARKRAALIDGLRKTMNEAIIHDLKNPMTSIMGCLSCVIRESPDVKLQQKLLRLALHSCRSQMALLETLVDTSRMEQGELTPRKAPLVLKEILDDILDDARGTAAFLGVDLKETIAEDIPTDLNADEELLRRILSNLIHNALKYTPAGGSVSLDISSHDSGVRFSITDTGIGIAAENLKRLFSKYYRVEGSNQTGRRGSGLGLYFCRLAVEAHGGTIRVSSTVDEGTTISFDIPGDVKGELKT
ncbi:MAG: HAMP domain-containing sensor histidine kinase [Elusimicrobiota bacterium]|jgi:signal transduction histidine kinase